MPLGSPLAALTAPDELLTEIIDQILMPLIQPVRLAADTGPPDPAGPTAHRSPMQDAFSCLACQPTAGACAGLRQRGWWLSRTGGLLGLAGRESQASPMGDRHAQRLRMTRYSKRLQHEWDGAYEFGRGSEGFWARRRTA